MSHLLDDLKLLKYKWVNSKQSPLTGCMKAAVFSVDSRLR